MNRSLIRDLAQIRSALILADPDKALRCLEKFVLSVQADGISAADRTRLEAELAELRVLADASLRGARQAFEEVQAIMQAARTLQTYDRAGRRHASSTAANSPRRF
ncbi:hypothetical protein JHW45_02865 [Paracoccus stylophorae]|uniref:Flagellar protein FliT n=1 Tax=Paracoccus stylophorae TaxID=659350 RepID=A0ABY7SYN9_9RHOB|nr:hypothetical protein [Paracoccus stylophorae]WCR11361.1 hypothetical protein JHW45_02865 [Paracoccus stylophorae]